MANDRSMFSKRLLLLLRRRAAVAGLLWGLVETIVLTLFTLGGGFINGVTSHLSFDCVSGSGCWLSGTNWHTITGWADSLSQVGLVIILGLAFLMGYAIIDWYSSFKSFFIAQGLSFTVYIMIFSLVPSSLCIVHLTVPLAISDATFAVISAYLIGLGILVIIVGGLLTIVGSVLGERYSQSPARPLKPSSTKISFLVPSPRRAPGGGEQ